MSGNPKKWLTILLALSPVLFLCGLPLVIDFILGRFLCMVFYILLPFACLMFALRHLGPTEIIKSETNTTKDISSLASLKDIFLYCLPLPLLFFAVLIWLNFSRHSDVVMGAHLYNVVMILGFVIQLYLGGVACVWLIEYIERDEDAEDNPWHSINL